MHHEAYKIYIVFMLYFSELENKQVVTTDGIVIGKLDDLIFLLNGKPKLSKLVIKTKTGKVIISSESLQKFNAVVRIAKYYVQTELGENELFVKKNILDKQIIDISGNKIVRANDVILQEQINLDTKAYECYISGVDIGSLGILRRLKLEDSVLKTLRLIGVNLVSKFLSWGDIQPLDLMRGSITVKTEETKLQNMRPEDLADYLEKTDELNVRKFLKILDKKFATNVISNLNINYQRALFQHWKPDKSASILEMIDPEETVDILLTLTKKRKEEILSAMDPENQIKLRQLIALSKTPIGKKITTEYMVASPTNTVDEILAKIKKETGEYSFFASVYVINNIGQLVGVFNPHDLLMQRGDTPVYKFMVQNLIEIRMTTPIEIAVNKLLRYHLPALPVVDNDRHILGIITFDHVADFIRQKMK